MPFGLTNATDTYQRALDMVLTKLKENNCLVYMDDFMIYSNTVEHHVSHADEIFTTLVEATVPIKMKKCTFFSDKVEYLGHVIRAGKLEVDNAQHASLR